MPRLSRRGLLAGMAAFAVPTSASPRPSFMAAASTRLGEHFVMGLDRGGRIVLRTPLPKRAHEVAPSPRGHAAFAAPRRPGTVGLSIDLRTGQVLRLCEADAGRHFYGHAVHSADGEHLFTTENDYSSARGVVTVRHAASLRAVARFDSGGIGPHQIAWLSKGTLAVANGGIRTHPSRPREKLNLASMRPNLSIIDVASGQLLDQVEGDHPQASIRHIAMAPGEQSNDAVLAMQYEGGQADDVPLVAAYRGRGILEPLAIPLAAQRALKQYVASVAVDAATGHAAATCPRADLVTFWNVAAARYVGRHRVGDCGGVAVDARNGEFVVSSGRGTILRFDTRTFALSKDKTVRHRDLKWDNHLSAIEPSIGPPLEPPTWKPAIDTAT